MACTYQAITKRYDVSVSKRNISQTAKLGSSFTMNVSYGDQQSLLFPWRFRIGRGKDVMKRLGLWAASHKVFYGGNYFLCNGSFLH